MKLIAFIDTETAVKSQKVLDIGSIKSTGEIFHSPSMNAFMEFLKGTQFICGHNIIKHDLKYIGRGLTDINFDTSKIIDTLFLSPLLFPKRPYHALVKDDKLQTEDKNNPLNDAKKAKDLFLMKSQLFNN